MDKFEGSAQILGSRCGVLGADLRWFTRPVRDCIDSCWVAAAMTALMYLYERRGSVKWHRLYATRSTRQRQVSRRGLVGRAEASQAVK